MGLPIFSSGSKLKEMHQRLFAAVMRSLAAIYEATGDPHRIESNFFPVHFTAIIFLHELKNRLIATRTSALVIGSCYSHKTALHLITVQVLNILTRNRLIRDRLLNNILF